MKTWIAVLLLATHAWGAGDDADRKAMLTRIGEPVPVAIYPLPERRFLPLSASAFLVGSDGNYFPLPTHAGSGTLDFPYYSGDWMPMSGSGFNSTPYQSLAVELAGKPSALAYRRFLAPSIRKMLEAFEAGRVGARDESRPLSTIEKVAKLDAKAHFDFNELVEPGVTYERGGDFLKKYYSAVTSNGVRYFFDPGVPDWWGMCDRMAVSNLDRHSHELIAKFPGGFCGDMPISREEMEDITTFFHVLPDTVKRYGKNRGNITDAETVSAEQLFFEETMGERPLAPQTFDKLLEANVRPGGPGLIIDESSSPRDEEYSYDHIWNRAIFGYTRLVQKLPLKWGSLTVLLVARYGRELLDAAGEEDEARAFAARLAAWRSSAAIVDKRFDEYLEAEFARRTRSLAFKPAKNVGDAAETKAAYEAARDAFRKEAEVYYAEARRLREKLVAKTGGPELFVEATRSKVSFPRQRDSWTAAPPKLFNKSYLSVRLRVGEKLTAPTWDIVDGDYPPDLAMVPPTRSPGNIKRLSRALASCTGVDKIEAAVGMLARLDKHGAPGFIGRAGCAIRYVDQDEAKRRFAEVGAAWDERGWERAVARCR